MADEVPKSMSLDIAKALFIIFFFWVPNYLKTIKRSELLIAATIVYENPMMIYNRLYYFKIKQKL